MKLGLDPDALPDQNDRLRWDELHGIFAAAFAAKTRDEWEAIFAGSDACVSPVLDMDEAPKHPAIAARGTFIDRGGVLEPAPAPRFSRTPASIRNDPPDPRATTAPALESWGISRERIDGLARAGLIPSPLA